jgi:hypothetical protein
MNKLQTDDGALAGEDEIRPIEVSEGKTKKNDTAAQKATAKPREVADYEKKNSGKKKVRTRDGATGY